MRQLASQSINCTMVCLSGMAFSQTAKVNVIVSNSDCLTTVGREDLRYGSFRLYRSVTEGAALCSNSTIHGVGVVLQQSWQLGYHPLFSHHLYWVQRASPGKNWPSLSFLWPSFFFVKFLPVCSGDVAAPAHYSIENGWCHHRFKGLQEWTLHSKRP